MMFNSEAERYKMTKLSREAIKDKLKGNALPSPAQMIKRGSLTHKQMEFSKGIALEGLTGADAYRKAYKSKAAPNVVANNASKLKTKHAGIQSTIAALEAAKLAESYNTAASLRSLVINTLVQCVTDPDIKPTARIAACRTLGQVTEVAAFTTRNETTVIKDSGELRLQILDELRSMMLSSNQSITDIDTDSLMAELIVGKSDEVSSGEMVESGELVSETALKEGGGGADPLFDVDEVPGSLHIIPDKQSFSPNISSDPPQSDSERVQKRAPYEK
jgi:hypothetical protein